MENQTFGFSIHHGNIKSSIIIFIIIAADNNVIVVVVDGNLM